MKSSLVKYNKQLITALRDALYFKQRNVAGLIAIIFASYLKNRKQYYILACEILHIEVLSKF
jgi:hypothetical protein